MADNNSSVRLFYVNNSSYRMLRRTSPLCEILKNWFSVVALWKVATFSLTKKVSGTQMSRMYSAPTTSFSIPKLDPLNLSLLRG